MGKIDFNKKFDFKKYDPEDYCAGLFDLYNEKIIINKIKIEQKNYHHLYAIGYSFAETDNIIEKADNIGMYENYDYEDITGHLRDIIYHMKYILGVDEL
jgi:hypothetical protein